MLFLQEAGAAAEHVEEQAEQAPILVRLVNEYFGEWAYNIEMKTTYRGWKWLFAKFGSTPEAVLVKSPPRLMSLLKV